MTEVSSRPYGKPCWVDLMASDREAAMRFYGDLLGWEFQVSGPEFGHYTTALVRGLPVAGIGEQTADSGSPQIPVAWTTYLSVDDVDATCEQVAKNGGTVLMPPMNIGGEGRLAVAGDPTGAAFGMWQAGRRTGAGITGEPGTACWHELMTPDSKAAREFYTAVFGYELEDLPEPGMDYSMLKLGGEPVAGIWGATEDLPQGTRSHWRVYFGVEDADAACVRVTDGGGAVLRSPVDSEYGRWAVVQDPQGAFFAVIKLP